MLDRFMNRGAKAYSESEQRGAQGAVASTLDLVPMQRLFGNMMVLRDGSYRMVMRVGALNFDLKGEREQMMILNTFGEMLNTLQTDFPLQILLHATHLDTESYVRGYRERLLDPTLTDQMRGVIEDHIQYFEEQAATNYLLDRSYFLVVPYYDRGAAPTGDGGAAAESMPLGGMLSRFMDSSSAEQKSKLERRDLERARIQLNNRCGLLASQLGRLAINATVLDDLALIRLLHEMYNPTAAERSSLQTSDTGGSFISAHGRDRAVLSRGSQLEGEQ